MSGESVAEYVAELRCQWLLIWMKYSETDQYSTQENIHGGNFCGLSDLQLSEKPWKLWKIPPWTFCHICYVFIAFIIWESRNINGLYPKHICLKRPSNCHKPLKLQRITLKRYCIYKHCNQKYVSKCHKPLVQNPLRNFVIVVVKDFTKQMSAIFKEFVCSKCKRK